MNRQCFWPLKSLHLWYHCLSTHFKKQCQQKVKFEDCSLKCHYLNMKESSIFHVWDSKSKQILESHNCFVDESITAYENIANIEVHSKKKTTSTSNHAVNLSSAFSFLLSQSSFVSEKVSASATLLLQFLLLQQSNSVSMYSLSSSVSERVFTSSHCQSELMSSDSWVLNKLFDLNELNSLNSSASAALCYNLHNCSVVDEFDAHVSYVYAAIFIDNIVKLTTYKQAVKSPLCDKWKMAMKNEIQSLKNNNMWDIVNVLSNQHVLKEHWVYKVKCDAHDQVSHYKAHWVVKGYEQQFNIDYDQIFMSVVKLQTYKTLFTLTTHYDLEVNQMNITTAFLYGFTIRLFMLSYLTTMSYSIRLLCWIRPFMIWSKYLICGIRLYIIFSCLLISVDLILIIACLYETVSSLLSMLMTFCLLKRISQLFRMLNNVLMTHSRCQISILCSTI